MKILNLYFKNIKSLEGEHRVHLDQPPISDAGVFAITGPNGSGKSTLLDVITLALFGETYRFDKPAEHVMTRQTADCFAEIEFRLADKKYRVRWQTQRKDDKPEGEIIPPEMQLFSVDGETAELLEQGAVNVRKRVAEIIGMDLHKFSKSMVLAQGEFSAFLNALDSERLDILEKITGEDIYQQYREKAEQHHQQVKQQYTLLEQDVAAIPVMDETSVEACEHDLADFQEQLTEFEQQQQQVQQQLEKISVLKQLESQVQAAEREHSQVLKTKTSHQQDLQNIDGLQAAADFKDDAQLLEQQQQQLEQRQQALEKFQQEVTQIQQQLQQYDAKSLDVHAEKSVTEQKQAVEQLKIKLNELKQELPQEKSLLESVANQLVAKKSALADIEKWLAEHQQDKVLLEQFPEIGKLKSLRQELGGLREKQKSHEKWTKETTSALKKNKEQIKNRSKTIKQLQQKVAETRQLITDISHGKSFEELEALKLEQQERVDDFIELYDLAKVNDKLNKKGLFGFLANRHQEKMDVDEQKLEDELHILELEIAKQENILKSLEKAVAYEALLKKMQKDRDKLEEGRPCPLCGSVHHPYVTHPPVIGDSKKALTDQKVKIKELKTRYDSVRIQLKEARKLQQQQSEKGSRLQLVTAQWNALANKLNVASSRLDIDDLSVMKKMLKSEKEELAEINRLIRKCTKSHNLIEKTEEDIKIHEHALERLKKEHEELNAQWDNRPRELVELEKAYEQIKQEEKTFTENIAQQLQNLGEELPEKGKEDELFDMLNQRRREIQARLAREKVLREEITALEEKVAICQEDVNELNQKLKQQSALLKTEEAASLHLALVEKQKLLAQKEQQVNEAQSALQNTRQALSNRLKETDFSNIDELQDALAKIEKKAEIETLLQQEQGKLDTLKQQLQQLEEELKQARADIEDIPAEEALLELQKNLKEKQDISRQEITTLQNKLNKHKTSREKLERLQQQLQQQRALLEQSEQEMALVSDENALPFRRKVQQQMIDRLLSHSNRVLEKISGRFYVRNKPVEQGFSLVIEDTLQNNAQRLPKTLSGGESFVVSLALALGLAESAANGHAIDSLFIDEGFGNLDAESLYLVMTTLENLKTQGKTVGIISHVEGVQKRVKTRIEMLKKKNGMSELKLVS